MKEEQTEWYGKHIENAKYWQNNRNNNCGHSQWKKNKQNGVESTQETQIAAV